MGVIREQEKWSEDIYRIQVTDPILGGADGIINVQPAQLANRTAFLKALLLAQHCDIGHHAVTDDMIAATARLAVEKLKLDVPLKEIREALSLTEDDVQDARDGLNTLIGADGLLIQGLAKIIQLTWRYADFGFEFEFFTDGLTMRDMKNIDTRGAVAYDDSLDCENVSGLTPGMRLLITDGAKSEEIEIWKVLERGRVRLTRDLIHTYSGLVTVGYTDWDLTEGSAVARKGKVFYSKVITVLENAPAGRLIIRRDSGNGKLLISYRDSTSDGDWIPVDAIELNITEDGHFDEHYFLEGGVIQLRIEGLDHPVTIEHMALFPLPVKQIVSSIRTPGIVEPAANAEVFRDMLELDASVFRCAYRDNFVQTEYAIVDVASDQVLTTFSTTEQQPFGPIHELDLPPNGIYAVRCRQQSDTGEWSAWSKPVHFTLKAIQLFFGFTGAHRSRGFGEERFYSLKMAGIRFGFIGAEDSAGFEEALFTAKLED